MSDTRWKAFERRIAVLLGTRRIAVTGERDGADFETPMFCFQAKKRKTFPGYVAEWLDLIHGKGATRTPAKIGVVILQRPRGADLDALVIVSLRDWLDLHGPTRIDAFTFKVAEVSDAPRARPVPHDASVHGPQA